MYVPAFHAKGNVSKMTILEREFLLPCKFQVKGLAVKINETKAKAEKT